MNANFISANPAPAATLSRLVRKEEIAERTTAFHFEKPPDWSFAAGQSLDVTLLNPACEPNGGPSLPAKRTLSIASGPHESTLMVAMRDSTFGRMLRAAPLGAAVRLEGPAGDVTLHEDASRAAVFLAGGIGVTPFRSMISRAAKEKLPHRIYLFYSNRRPEEAPFLDEFEAIEREYPNFRLIANMTAIAGWRNARGCNWKEGEWKGEVGPIDRSLLSKHLRHAPSPVYYLAGPMEMVMSFRAMLQQEGIPDAQIRGDQFCGRTAA